MGHRHSRPPGLGSMPQAVAEAWADSFLSASPPAVVERLLDGAHLAEMESGEIFYRGAHHREMATVSLVVSGLLRIYMTDAEGREVTIRYASSGAVVGIPAVVMAGPGDAGSVAATHWRILGGERMAGEALRPSQVLRMCPIRFQAVVQRDPAMAWSIARHLAEQLAEAQHTLAADLFLPVRSRVAGHLLNLAEREQGAFVVRSNHQTIAAAVGSVREVVSRALKRMERDGLVERVGGPSGHLRLVDSAELHRVAQGQPAAVA